MTPREVGVGNTRRRGERRTRIALAVLSGALGLVGTYAAVSVLTFSGLRGGAIAAGGVVLAIGLSVLITRLQRLDRTRLNVVRAGAMGIAIGLLGAPWLINVWIRGDYDRYVWVIRQGGACGYMGSGPGTLVLFMAAWPLALALAGLLTATRDQVAFVGTGVAVGALLVVVMTLVLFVDQRLLASLLGCL